MAEESAPESIAGIPEARIRRALKALDVVGGVPPGHWSSPYPSDEDIDRAGDRWDAPPEELPGIDLRPDRQLELVQRLAEFRGDVELPADPDPGWRYFHANQAFGEGDAHALYGMLRHLRPRRVIEVGSGHSSALMLDVAERFFADGEIDFVFIEPYPRRLRQLLREGDLDRAEVLVLPVQSAPLSLFDGLGESDILFIDSSHIVRTGGDVNHLLFEVLPRLKPRVHVHVHDIFYPFEYPREWVAERRLARSEAYLLRGFLQYNERFEIRLFGDYLRRFHADALEGTYPELMVGPPGNIWLRSRG